MEATAEEQHIKEATTEGRQADSTMEERRRGEALPGDGHTTDGAEGGVAATSVVR